MKVFLSSKSEKKIEAVKEAFAYLNIVDYELETYKVASDVSDSPLNEETLQGAKNRNNNLKKIVQDYDMLISIEAGFTKEEDDYYVDTYCVIEYDNKEFLGKSPRVVISKNVYEYVKNGNLLHLFIEQLQGTVTNDGVVGFLTNGKVKRTELEEVSVISALIKALGFTCDNLKLDLDNNWNGEQAKKLDMALKMKL